MDTVSNLVKRFLIFISVLFIGNTAYNQDFITFKHVGEEDSPISGIIIIQGDSNFFYKSAKFTRYIVNNVDYEILKWFILNKKLKKNKNCGCTRKTHGAFEIRIYEDGKLICFLLDNPLVANRFIKGLIIESVAYGFDQDLINDFRRIRDLLDKLEN